MRRFAIICRTEFLLFIRDFFGFFFTLIFPLLMLLLFGGIYGNAPIYQGAQTGWMDLSVPAYSVMIMGVTGLMSFPLTLAECKEKKIYKRFDATPAGKKSIILAQTAVNLFMTLAGFLILLLAGKILYQIRIQGNVFEVSAAIVLSVAAMFSMGFFFTAVGRDSKITNVLCYLFYFVMIFLSGATMPDEMFPDTIKMAARFLPMTYAVDLMQGIFRGNGLAQHMTDILILMGITAAFTAAGAILYKRKDWA